MGVMNFQLYKDIHSYWQGIIDKKSLAPFTVINSFHNSALEKNVILNSLKILVYEIAEIQIVIKRMIV
jgi:hypothetical protein